MENENDMASAEDVAAERPFEEAAAGEDTPAGDGAEDVAAERPFEEAAAGDDTPADDTPTGDGADRSDALLEDCDARAESAASGEDTPEGDGADRSDALLEDCDARAESAASGEDTPEGAECPDDPDELVVVEGEEQVGQTAAESTEPEDRPGRRPGAASGVAAKVRSHRFSQVVLLRPNSVGRVAILSAVSYVVAVGAAYFLIAQPLSNRLHNVGERMSMLHDVTVIEQANAALVSFTDGLMTGDQRLTVMSEFGLMAKDTGVKLIGDPELLMPREVSKLVVEYPARLRIKGTYHEIGTFLSLLESSPRFVQVEEVEILSDMDSRAGDSEATVLLALASWGE